MEIPKILKVGGHSIKVLLVPKDEASEKDYCGETSYQEDIIRIDSSLSQGWKESSLIHEILHNLNTTMDHEFLDSLAEQLYQVLKDNNLLR